MLTTSARLGLEKLRYGQKIAVGPAKEIGWKFCLDNMDVEFIERYLRKKKLEKIEKNE